MLKLDQKLVTVNVPECPLCRRIGEIRYTGLEDGVFSAPGKWNYRACERCDILWLDPRPTSECFSLIYPEDYLTHSEAVDFLSASIGSDRLTGLSPLANLRLQVKLEVLHRAYGYPLCPSGPFARFIGAIAACIPGIRSWAGFTVRFLPANKGRLLDVGCGNGQFLLTMSKLGWEVFGIEPDGVSALLGRTAGVRIHEGSVESALLEPESFDAITMNHVIEHLSDPLETLKKLINALRPGGWLVSISPNPSSLLSRWFKMSWRGLEPSRHLVLLGSRALINLSQQFGLESTVWTTARNSKWMARESISILRHGNIKDYRGNHLPVLVASGCSFLTMLNKELGEEVVLIARKK